MRAAGRLAVLAVVLTLAVVAASATIRLGAATLGDAMTIVRGVHRAAASLAAFVVVLLFWRTRRSSELRRAASFAFLLMLALSAVGWATGTRPPPAAALFNQVGGIALAALLAWIAGRASGNGAAERGLATAAVLLAALQILFGATLAMLGSVLAPVLWMAHAVLGLAAAAVGISVGARSAALGAATRGAILIAAAALVPLAGVLAVLPAPVLAVQVVHASAAALLLAALAHALGCSTRSA